MNQSLDLALTPTSELIAELAKRHDGLIVAGIKFNTMSNFALTKYWGGNHFVCLGILQDMIHQINKQGDKNFTPDQ